jgi:hypothetical protein
MVRVAVTGKESKMNLLRDEQPLLVCDNGCKEMGTTWVDRKEAMFLTNENDYSRIWHLSIVMEVLYQHASECC